MLVLDAAPFLCDVTLLVVRCLCGCGFRQFPISLVVAQLRGDPLIELAYLTCMFDNRKTEYDRSELAEYHNRQVLLHVQHQVSCWPNSSRMSAGVRRLAVHEFVLVA